MGKAGDRRFFFSPRIISVGTGIPAEDVSWVARVRWDTAAATRGEIPRAATASHVRIGPQSSSEPTQNDTWEMRREWPRNNTCAMVQQTHNIHEFKWSGRICNNHAAAANYITVSNLSFLIFNFVQLICF